MTDKLLKEANKNRDLRKLKLEHYNKINSIINDFADQDREPYIDVNYGLKLARIRPTKAELKMMLILMRERVDKEISDLDREFENL